jgi:hypothetical protein
MRKTAPTPMSARKANPPTEPPIIAPRGGELDVSELVEVTVAITEITIKLLELTEVGLVLVVDGIEDDDILELLLDDVVLLVEDDVLDELVVEVAVLNPVNVVKTLPSCPE